MNKNIIIIACFIAVAGCAPKKPEIIDPCKAAPTMCFGKAGQSPLDVAGCDQVISCSNWRLEAR